MSTNKIFELNYCFYCQGLPSRDGQVGYEGRLLESRSLSRCVQGRPVNVYSSKIVIYTYKTLIDTYKTLIDTKR